MYVGKYSQQPDAESDKIEYTPPPFSICASLFRQQHGVSRDLHGSSKWGILVTRILVQVTIYIYIYIYVFIHLHIEVHVLYMVYSKDNTNTILHSILKDK